MAPTHFAERLMAEVACKRSQVVVGLDPRAGQLPPELVPAVAGPRELADAFVAFGQGVVHAVAEHAVAVKPQVAFYEALGCEGMRAYAQTIAIARRAGLIVIADVKRSDIASTAAAYAAGHLGAPPASRPRRTSSPTPSP